MEEQQNDILRHSTAHVMAQAIKRLYPEVKLAIGPATKDGFCYDIDMETSLLPDDFKKIEKEMQKIVKERQAIERFILPRDKAINLMKERHEKYKIELVDDIPTGEEISFYKQGEFIDLCRGPHLNNTSEIKSFKLMSLSGAYWKGNERNKMLQRIYGVAFNTKEELDEHLNFLEETKKKTSNNIKNRV